MKLNELFIGQSFVNSSGEKYIIEDIRKIQKKGLSKMNFITECIVLFEETKQYQIIYASHIGSDKVRDYSKPHTFGVGYIKGTKDNPAKADTSSYLGSYQVWYNMLYRCYKDGVGLKAYKDVKVCESWHDYNCFKKWYGENAPKDSKIEMHLDKDLLKKGDCKVYSPETCCFLPKSINACLVGLNNFKEDNITETSAKSVYKLSLLIERFDCLLNEKVKKKLQGIVGVYKTKYKKMTGRSLMNDFKDIDLKKADLSKIKITSFLEMENEVFSFKTMKDLKDFIVSVERKAELTQTPVLTKISGMSSG